MTKNHQTLQIEKMRQNAVTADARAAQKLREHGEGGGAGAALEIVRKDQVSKFIPLGRTRIDDLIAAGLLEIVPLTASGHSKGVTLRSIRRYQQLVMGLKQLPIQST